MTNTIILTEEIVEGMDYKTLRAAILNGATPPPALAVEEENQNIQGDDHMIKEEMTIEQVEQSASEASADMEICRECGVNPIDSDDPSNETLLCWNCQPSARPMLPEPDADEDDMIFEEEKMNYTPAPKVFEFVRADNCVVIFKQKGVEVTIGWSKKTFRCHMQKEGKAQYYSAQTAINAMKKFKNGVHGDVAQIVKALTRLRTKPSIIIAMEKKARAAASAPASSSSATNDQRSSAKPSRRTSFVSVDAEWLKRYKEEQGDQYDARLVRSAYDQYLANN